MVPRCPRRVGRLIVIVSTPPGFRGRYPSEDGNATLLDLPGGMGHLRRGRGAKGPSRGQDPPNGRLIVCRMESADDLSFRFKYGRRAIPEPRKVPFPAEIKQSGTTKP